MNKTHLKFLICITLVYCLSHGYASVISESLAHSDKTYLKKRKSADNSESSEKLKDNMPFIFPSQSSTSLSQVEKVNIDNGFLSPPTPSIPSNLLISQSLENNFNDLNLSQQMPLATSVKNKKDDIRVLLEQGHSLRMNGQIREAIDIFNQVLMIPDLSNEGKIITLLYRALSLRVFDHHQEAINDVDQIFKMSPLDNAVKSKAFHSRGLSYLSLHRYQEACDNFEQFISIPNTINALARGFIDLGYSKRMLGRYPEAIHYFEAALFFKYIMQPSDMSYIYKQLSSIYEIIDMHSHK